MPATGGRSKSSCAPKCSKGKTQRCFISAVRRPNAPCGKQLPADADVRLTVRFDIEDRNFHWETKHNGGADHHFSTNTHKSRPGPEIRNSESVSPLRPRRTANCACLRTAANIIRNRSGAKTFPHPVEQSRGQTGSGDAYSPGWFELPLPKGASVTLVATAENERSFAQNSELPASGAARNTNGQNRRARGRRSVRRLNLYTPRNNSSSGAARAKPSLPVIRGFWIGAAIRSLPPRLACRRHG